MIELSKGGAYLVDGVDVIEESAYIPIGVQLIIICAVS